MDTPIPTNGIAVGYQSFVGFDPHEGVDAQSTRARKIRDQLRVRRSAQHPASNSLSTLANMGIKQTMSLLYPVLKRELKSLAMLALFAAILVPAYAAAAPDGERGGVALDVERYRPFLLGEWRDGLPVVVVMMDPNCGYCTRSVRKLDTLVGYNTFLFWAPILGLDSRNRVEQFFRCSNPVGSEVRQAVAAHKRPQCRGEVSPLLSLNREVVELFKPWAVPSYYLDGNRTSLARLRVPGSRATADSSFGFAASPIGRVVVDWERYNEFRYGSAAATAESVALVLDPSSDSSSGMLAGLSQDRRYDWYVFWREAESGPASKMVRHALRCPTGPTGPSGTWSIGADGASCDDNVAARLVKNQEFQLLMGTRGVPAAYLNGREISLGSLWP